MSNSESIHVSVVVPCRNEVRFIRGFLDSVLSQDSAGMDLEIVIADGMSDDGTREILCEYEKHCPLLRVIVNHGKIASTGLNAAIRASKGEVIIRMDAHTEYAPDYIRNCVQLLKETGADNVGGPALTRADGFMAQAVGLAFHSPFTHGGSNFHNGRYEGFVDTVPYGCWRKSTLERIGLFDESLVRNQDDELNFRIISAGGKIWQSPRIISWYRPRVHLRDVFRQYFQYGFWKVAVIRKHRRHASWRHLVPAITLGCGVLLVVGSIGGLLTGARGWTQALWIIGALLASMYIIASLGAALNVAARNGWRVLPILPLVFATHHVAYGSGFLWGLSRWAASPRSPGCAHCSPQ